MKKKIIFDIGLALLLIAISLILYAFLSRMNAKGSFAVVYYNGEEVERYELGEDVTVKLGYGGGHNTLVISEGSADITDADCPDGVCERMKSISKCGESIICLPHRLEIRVEGGENTSDGENDI